MNDFGRNQVNKCNRSPFGLEVVDMRIVECVWLTLTKGERWF
ncbi:MAG: hypothetical protein ACTS7I_00390 [Candidatus Hodgkinia cicadicola]